MQYMQPAERLTTWAMSRLKPMSTTLDGPQIEADNAA